MNKVQLTCYNRQILVDVDQVKYHIMKSTLVESSVAAQNASKDIDPNSPLGRDNIALLSSYARQIQSLNKKIRKNVQFV